MNFFMWLFAVKKLEMSYNGTVECYDKMSETERLKLYQEFCEEGYF